MQNYKIEIINGNRKEVTYYYGKSLQHVQSWIDSKVFNFTTLNILLFDVVLSSKTKKQRNAFERFLVLVSHGRMADR